MIRYVLTGFSLFLPFFTFSQDTLRELPLLDTVPNWRFSANTRLNFSQVHLSNWVAGGESAYSAGSFLDIVTNYKKLKRQWENRVELGYGFLRNPEGFIKTDDKIDFTSNYSYRLKRNFNYSALLTFRTQFTEGYETSAREVLISDFMAPAYFIGSLGINFKKDNLITIILSPIAGRLTVVDRPELSAQGAFGVQPGRRTREEVGAHFRSTFRKENIFENITVQVNLDLFSNYLEKPENLNVNWETLVVFKVNRFVSANVSTHLIYDDDIMIGRDTTGDGEPDAFGPRTQFKQVFNLGLSYNF